MVEGEFWGRECRECKLSKPVEEMQVLCRGRPVIFGNMSNTLPENEGEIEEFVGEFEALTLPKERWTHGAHLLTGAWYVHGLGEAEALDRMRRNVSRYNVAMGGQNTATSGYHETVTAFWMKALAGLLQECSRREGVGRAAFARMAVERFEGDREILRRFYDFDVVGSEEARRVWVEPTLERLG